MCGIFGYFSFSNKTLADELLSEMRKALDHRGPDGHGYYHDENKGVALGNTRLAILDVEFGQQPFFSDDGQITVVQNGEIFNHLEIHKELQNQGVEFKTNCDTEVILKVYEKYGIDGLSKFNGMFAIAIYDKRLDTLFLVRDRIGEKPLFYLRKDDILYFSSEIKSILKASGKLEFEEEALNQYLTFNYIPPPLTMFKNVRHVLPGHYIAISKADCQSTSWWDLSENEIRIRSEKEWIDEFNHTLFDSVGLRLRSDVPFGAFLSGGVDSSSVVGMMSEHLASPVNTFCIGFNDPKYDESIYAQAAANRFKTNHHMEKVAPNMLDMWPSAVYYSDQPHGDVSFLPTYKVAELASKSVKMVLTGDGADELFAGYDKYKNFFNKNDHNSAELFQKAYLLNISLFSDAEKLHLLNRSFLEKLDSPNMSRFLRPLFKKVDHMDRINQALYIDMMLLLPGNNLVKPDRMGMAVSLENRAPFLDYRMMELCFSIPGSLKLHEGETKYLYKKAVSSLVGHDLAYRKKQMFTVPVGEWFKSVLLPLCRELLLSDRAKSRGLFNSLFIEAMLQKHVSGEANYTREIRALMAVELWFRQFIDG